MDEVAAGGEAEAEAAVIGVRAIGDGREDTVAALLLRWACRDRVGRLSMLCRLLAVSKAIGGKAAKSTCAARSSC